MRTRVIKIKAFDHLAKALFYRRVVVPQVRKRAMARKNAPKSAHNKACNSTFEQYSRP